MKLKQLQNGIVSVLFAGLSIGSFAQSDSLQLNVTFVGSRNIEVSDAIKMTVWPTTKSLPTSKQILSYELLTRKLEFEPSMTPIEVTRLRVDPSLSRLYRGYARGAIGSRGTSMLDVSYTDLRSRDGSWGTSFHHTATNSPSALLTGRINNNQFNTWGTRFLGKEKISIEAGASRNQILLYGFDSLAVDNQFTPVEAPSTIWSRASLSTEFKSHKKDSTAFNHVVDAQINWLGNDSRSHERSIQVNAEGFTHVGNWRAELDAGVQLDSYGIDTAQTLNQAIVTFDPSVSTHRGPLSIQVGLGLAIDSDQPTRDNLGDAFHLYPRAEFSVNLLRDLFVPYARLGGELNANNFQSLTALNPFYVPTQLQSEVLINDQPVIFEGFRSTNKRLALTGGIRGTVTKSFQFHAYFNTAEFEDYALFKPGFDSDSTGLAEFTLAYDTLSIRTLGGEAELNMGDSWKFSGGVQLLRYSLPTEDRPWNLPNVKWQASASYALIEGLSLSAQANYIGERFSIVRNDQFGDVTPLDNGNFELRLPGYLDLNLTTTYRYNDRLGGWLTLANLANSKYAVWGGFPVQGFQVLAGVHYAF